MIWIEIGSKDLNEIGALYEDTKQNYEWIKRLQKERRQRGEYEHINLPVEVDWWQNTRIDIEHPRNWEDVYFTLEEEHLQVIKATQISANYSSKQNRNQNNQNRNQNNQNRNQNNNNQSGYESSGNIYNNRNTRNINNKEDGYQTTHT